MKRPSHAKLSYSGLEADVTQGGRFNENGGFFVAKFLLLAVMLEMGFCCFLMMMNCM